MSIRVIELFEIIDIDHGQREPPAVAHRAAPFAVEGFVELPAIGDASEAIDEGELPEPILSMLNFNVTFDSRDENLCMHRLGNEVHRAKLYRMHFQFVPPICGHEDYWRVSQFRRAANFRQGLMTIHSRHFVIQKHNIRKDLSCHLKSGFSAAGRQHLEFFPKNLFHHRARNFVIVDHENTGPQRARAVVSTAHVCEIPTTTSPWSGTDQ